MFPGTDGSRRGNDRDFRVDCIDLGLERLQIAEIHFAPIFVSESDVFKAKRSGMPVLCAQSAPFGGRVAVGVFDQVKDILHIRIPFGRAGAKRNGIEVSFKILAGVHPQALDVGGKFRPRFGILRVEFPHLCQIGFPFLVGHIIFLKRQHMVIVAAAGLADQPYVEDRYRFRTEVTAKLEIFMITDHVAVVIIDHIVLPDVVILFARFGRADGVFPIEEIFETVPFCHTAAGETNE